MKIERFKYLVISIEDLCRRENEIRRKQTTTTSGSNTWRRYEDQIVDAQKVREVLWKEIEASIKE